MKQLKFTAILLLALLTNLSFAEQKLYFVHNDHLGTPRILTDENQTVVWQAEYTPFGEATIDEDPDGDGTAVSFNLRFPGQYYDKETGLNYNYYRTYDPKLGRYIESDPVGLRGGINTYGYAYQNPLMYTDPDGRTPAAAGLCFVPGIGWVGCGVAAVVVGVVAAVAYVGGQIAVDNMSSSGDTTWDDDDDVSLPPFWPDHPDAIPIPDAPPIPGENAEREEYCREKCANEALPSGDNGFRYWNCYNQCMEEDEWCE